MRAIWALRVSSAIIWRMSASSPIIRSRIVRASFVFAISQLLSIRAVPPGLHRPLLAQVVFEQPLDDGLLGLIGLRHMDLQGAYERLGQPERDLGRGFLPGHKLLQALPGWRRGRGRFPQQVKPGGRFVGHDSPSCSSAKSATSSLAALLAGADSTTPSPSA